MAENRVHFAGSKREMALVEARLRAKNVVEWAESLRADGPGFEVAHLLRECALAIEALTWVLAHPEEPASAEGERGL